MNRKKLYGPAVFAAIFAGTLALSGCAGTTALGVLDESVPEASLCPLEIRNRMDVVLYDNQPVEWGSQGFNTRATISLPPGEHTFMLRWVETRNNGQYTSTITKTASITQNFLPGHSYQIYQQRIWLLLFTIVNVKCKEIAPRESAEGIDSNQRAFLKTEVFRNAPALVWDNLSKRRCV
jgi:hypothetical protein